MQESSGRELPISRPSSASQGLILWHPERNRASFLDQSRDGVKRKPCLKQCSSLSLQGSSMFSWGSWSPVLVKQYDSPGWKELRIVSTWLWAASVRQCAFVSLSIMSVMLSFCGSTAVHSSLCYRPGSDPGCYSIPLISLWTLSNLLSVCTITRKQKARIFGGSSTHHPLPVAKKGLPVSLQKAPEELDLYQRSV